MTTPIVPRRKSALLLPFQQTPRQAYCNQRYYTSLRSCDRYYNQALNSSDGLDPKMLAGQDQRVARIRVPGPTTLGAFIVASNSSALTVNKGGESMR